MPELKDVPEKYIYEPWKMPKPDQKTAHIEIGGDRPGHYPKPMFDVQEQFKIALAGMKSSYAAKIYGNDKRVSSGAARKVIESKANGNDDDRKRKGEQGSLNNFVQGNKKKKQKTSKMELPASEDEDNEQMD